MYFKTSAAMALPDGVESFDFAGCTYFTSVEDRAFIERTTCDDEDANVTMCVAPLPPPFPLFVLHLTLHLQGVRFARYLDDAGTKGLWISRGTTTAWSTPFRNQHSG
jgi:hypothetical protein